MSKYIDADKLIAEIRKRLKSLHGWETRNKTYYRNLGKESAQDEVLSIIASLQQQERTCKTCGFYENNCPFIRGKLIPYPNKVCKDYTYSVMKEQAQVADASKMERLNVDDLHEWSMRYAPGFREMIEATAYHFWNLAINSIKEK